MGEHACNNHHHYKTFLKCLELGARLTAPSIQYPFPFQPLNFLLKKKKLPDLLVHRLCLLNLGRLLVITYSLSFPTTFRCTPHEKGFYLYPALRSLLNTQSYRSQEQQQKKSVSHFIWKATEARTDRLYV